MNRDRQDGYTLIEIVVVIAIVLILASLLGPLIVQMKNARADWETGEFTIGPQIVAQPPGTASYVFMLTKGTGVDANGNPIISVNPSPIRGRNVTFTVAPGDPANQGIITTLNTSTIDAASGAVVTDTLGIVAVGVSLDGYGSWKITAVVAPDASGKFGGTETVILVTQ